MFKATNFQKMPLIEENSPSEMTNLSQEQLSIKSANSYHLIRLPKELIKPAARMAARAFHDDPLFSHFYPDPAERKKRLPHLLEGMIRYTLRYGEVYATSPNLEGIALWLPSDKAAMGMWGTLRSGALRPMFKAGMKAMMKAMPCYEFNLARHKALAPFRHLYLSILAVDPNFQGKGHSSALVKGMLTENNPDNLPCFLETENPRNVPIYQHLGFRVQEEKQIPGTEVWNWALLREASS
ncbi:MAG: GNAT family N-acetyltransferase [Candidatus Heimdallarchaeota archaeon]